MPARGRNAASIRVVVLLAVTVLLSAVASPADAAAAVRINEIMAKNAKTLRDDRDKSSDWIELWVEGGVPSVDLTGWALTDDPAHEETWAFPARELELGSGGYLLVYASGEADGESPQPQEEEEREGAGGAAAPLHASFKLGNKAGGYLALLDPEGAVVDEIKRYPHQYKDVAWGRSGSGKAAPFAYLSRATPGQRNAPPMAEGTPLVKSVTKSTRAPLTTREDLQVRACVAFLSSSAEPADLPARAPDGAEVELRYKVNFETREYSARMKPVLLLPTTATDNGTSSSDYCGDEGFQEYAAVLEKKQFSGPAGAHPGDMIRWYVEAKGGHGLAARAPSLEAAAPGPAASLGDLASAAADLPRYYGTVVVSPEEKSAKTAGGIDKLFWFIPDRDKWQIEKSQCSAFPCLADKSETHVARCSFYFQGRFYDNVKMRQRGISALLWPKKKFKVDFKGANFKIRLSENEEIDVEEFNLQSHWEEPGEETFMRENIASDFFKEAGLPVFETLHVELVQNGQFYGLYSIVEQIDGHFLKRVGYNPKGQLYKAFSGTASNLNERVPERLMDKVYRRGNKVADEEDWSDLHELTQSLAGKNSRYATVEEYLYNHMNLPELVNELALQAAILNQDRCTKNYYVYYDSDLEEWSRFAWDMEAAMGISSALGGFPAPDYCMLVCPQFNSPLYCDSDHPQDPLPNFGQTPRSSNYVRKATVVPGLETPEKNYNHLTDALLDTPSTREMYLRRLKTIVDKYVATDYLRGRVEAYYAKISDSARRDDAKWDTGDIVEGYQQLLKEQLPQRKDQLLKTYAAGGPDALLPPSQSAAEQQAVEIKNAYIPLNGEYTPSIELRNPSADAAVDVSGWVLTNAQNVSEARAEPRSKPFCDDVAPKNAEYSCEDLQRWGSCELESVQKKGLCRKSCGNCRLHKGPVRFTFAPGTVIPSNSSLFVTDDVVKYRRSLRKYQMHQFVVGPVDGKLERKPLYLYNDRSDLMAEKALA